MDGPAVDGWSYLEDRGLDVELLARMGVKPATVHGGVRVRIPFVRGGRPYVAKYAKIGASDDGPRYLCLPAGGPAKSLWNVDALTCEDLQGDPVIITEGEFDALSVIQAGFPRAVSLPDGWLDPKQARDPAAKLGPVLEVEDELRAAPRVIIAGDNDDVGDYFVRVMAGFLDETLVYAVRWPDGCKDANDTLRTHGAQTVAECIRGARQVDPPGATIYYLDEIPPQAPRWVLRTGDSVIDRVCALETGAISVSTGYPGSGKTTFMVFLGAQVAKHEHVRVAFLCMETNIKKIRDDLSILHLGKSWDKASTDERLSLRQSCVVVKREDFGGGGNVEAHDMEWLRVLIRDLAVKYGCKLIVVDPWNEIDHAVSPGETETQYVNVALAKIRQWAERYHAHVHIVAHPRKASSHGGANAAPQGQDIAGSAAFVNKPAIGWSVHVTEDDDGVEHTQVLVWKVRDRELYETAPCTLKLAFDPAKRMYRRTMR